MNSQYGRKPRMNTADNVGLSKVKAASAEAKLYSKKNGTERNKCYVPAI